MSDDTLLWQVDRFPVVYEQGQPKAVVVDLETFKRLELVLDNLLNREPEPEDDLIAEAAGLKQLVTRVRAVAEPMPEWKQALDEL